MSLKKIKIKNKSTGDLSALIEMRPQELDDRTSAIDPANLRKAKQEAAIALSHSKKTERRLHGRSNKFRIVGFVVGITFLVGLGVVLTGQGNWSQLNRIFSSLPTLDDVNDEDYALLEKAVASKTPELAIAQSSLSLVRPAFYIAGSLPEGSVLNFYLRPVLDTLLVDNVANIQFPLTLSKHLAKSIPVTTMEGLDLPKGEYQAAVTEEGQQTASDQKYRITRSFFLGGKKDAEYLAQIKLKNEQRKVARQNILNKTRSELAEIQAWLNSSFKFTGQLKNFIQNSLSELKSKSKVNQIQSIKRKQWIKFSKGASQPIWVPAGPSTVSKLREGVAALQHKIEEAYGDLQRDMNNGKDSNVLTNSLQQVIHLEKTLVDFQSELKAILQSMSGGNGP